MHMTLQRCEIILRMTHFPLSPSPFLPPPTADCTPQTTAPFRLVNSSGCYSLRAITADLCGGSCGYNKCCRGVFKKKNVHYITVTIECPHRPYQPLNRYFEVPSRCVCKWCIAPYTVPGFMGENWRIVY